MGWRHRLTRGHVALVVLAVLAIAFGAIAVQRQLAPAATPLPGPVDRAGSPVAFVGDSYTSGTPDGGLGPANWTSILSARNGWTGTDAAVAGAGYVAAPPGGGPFIDQVSRVVEARPTLVVIVGGSADATAPAPAVRAAADRLYRDLRIQLPRARIIVVGPVWPGDDAPPTMLEARDAVRDAARAAQLPFLDPIADEWFPRPDDPGVTPDRQQLNDAGHQVMADLVGEGLRRTPVPS